MLQIFYYDYFVSAKTLKQINVYNIHEQLEYIGVLWTYLIVVVDS